MRSAHPTWGPRRLVYELAQARTCAGVGVGGVPGVGAVEPDRSGGAAAAGPEVEAVGTRRADGAVADGRGRRVRAGRRHRAKALTGVDDHSRFCVSAHLMVRESSQRVCDGLALALRDLRGPGQILTDNGKVFTGRFNRPPVEVLFDRICRENGIEHLLTQPRSPTTTGKVERFHRAIRTEFRTDRVFATLAAAQAELDEWVVDYNTSRPHQALGMATPASGSCATEPRPSPNCGPPRTGRPGPGEPPRRDLGRPSSQRSRRGVRELATGLPRRRSRRPHSTCGSPTRSCSSTTATSLLRTKNRTNPGGGESQERPKSPSGKP